MPTRPRILIVDDDGSSRQAIIDALAKDPASIKTRTLEAGTLALARTALQEEEFVCVFLGQTLPDGAGQDFLMEMRSQGLATPVIMLTEGQDEQAAFEVMQAGGTEYLPQKKLRTDLVARSLQAALRFLEVQRDREAALAELQAYDRALASSSHGVVIADPRQSDCPLVYTNEAFLQMTGYTSLEVVGRNCRFLQGEGTDSAATQKMHDAIRSGAGCHVAMLNYRKNGSTFWNDITISPVRDKDGTLIHFIGVQADTTARYEADNERARLLEIATQDAAETSALYERERRIAEALQRSLLTPPPKLVSGLEVETLYRAAWDEAQVGGDFYDCFPLDENRLALVVGDVSGKGLRAASRTAEVKYTLRAYLREYTDAASALKRLNAFLCESQGFEEGDAEYFVILTLAVLDSATGAGEIAVAGAEAPLVRRADGVVEEMQVSGLPLAVIANADYRAVPLSLAAGDLLLVSTDGVTEARRGREFLGLDGLVRLMHQAEPAKPLVKISEEILRGVQNYASGPLHDDVCLLLARLR